jgi:hypothetical protein
MLIPRFTLRRLLLVMTGISVVCVIIAQASRGHAWAIAISMAVAGLVLCFLVYAALFSAAFTLAAMFGLTRRRAVVAASPFAAAQPPEQLVPPEDPE